VKKGFLVLSIFFLLFLCQEAWSITGLGIGIRGGIIQNYKNDNLDSIPTLGQDWLKEMPLVGVHLKIGTLRVIRLEASIEYAWKKKEIALKDLSGNDLVRADFSIHDLSLNGTAKYVLSVPVLKPYVGAGLGVHRLVYGISNEVYSMYVPEDQNKIGFHGVGGFTISFPASPVELLAEARYTSIRTENEPTRYTTFLAGLTFKLP
jgi:opacity protein-like surface antigen